MLTSTKKYEIWRTPYGQNVIHQHQASVLGWDQLTYHTMARGSGFFPSFNYFLSNKFNNCFWHSNLVSISSKLWTLFNLVPVPLSSVTVVLGERCHGWLLFCLWGLGPQRPLVGDIDIGSSINDLMYSGMLNANIGECDQRKRKCEVETKCDVRKKRPMFVITKSVTNICHAFTS